MSKEFPLKQKKSSNKKVQYGYCRINRNNKKGIGAEERNRYDSEVNKEERAQSVVSVGIKNK